jgi:hypothetical protein
MIANRRQARLDEQRAELGEQTRGLLLAADAVGGSGLDVPDRVC